MFSLTSHCSSYLGNSYVITIDSEAFTDTRTEFLCVHSWYLVLMFAVVVEVATTMTSTARVGSDRVLCSDRPADACTKACGSGSVCTVDGDLTPDTVYKCL